MFLVGSRLALIEPCFLSRFLSCVPSLCACSVVGSWTTGRGVHQVSTTLSPPLSYLGDLLRQQLTATALFFRYEKTILTTAVAVLWQTTTSLTTRTTPAPCFANDAPTASPPASPTTPTTLPLPASPTTPPTVSVPASSTTPPASPTTSPIHSSLLRQQHSPISFTASHTFDHANTNPDPSL